MRVVCLSDTHNVHREIQVPDGDLLLHAGDATATGSEREIRAFDEWLGALPHRHKVLIAGNHDFLFQTEPSRARALVTSATYLEDEETVVEGLRIWGSPWQPWFFDWAFNLRRGAPLRAKWSLIPSHTDILLTHSPPHGVLDEVTKAFARAASLAMGEGGSAGCEELLGAVLRVKPRLHVFGHIHEGYGEEVRDGVRYVNAAICDLAYRPVNAPVVVDL